MSIREVTEITPDGEHDYLAPYGGRRGVGDVPYRADPVLAQTAPRHRSIETTSKTAAPTPKPGKPASRAGDAFDTDRETQQKTATRAALRSRRPI